MGVACSGWGQHTTSCPVLLSGETCGRSLRLLLHLAQGVGPEGGGACRASSRALVMEAASPRSSSTSCLHTKEKDLQEQRFRFRFSGSPSSSGSGSGSCSSSGPDLCRKWVPL